MTKLEAIEEGLAAYLGRSGSVSEAELARAFGLGIGARVELRRLLARLVAGGRIVRAGGVYSLSVTEDAGGAGAG